MSFSGTPLGQDRRLDHQTFLKGGFYPKTAASGRLQPINPSIPLSYAYGAPRASESLSQPHSHSPERHTEVIEVDDEERTARYSQLKQRNQALANRPGSSLGPGVITTPPQPTPASAKDTSVNIASAFHQALNAMAPPETTNNWQTNRTHVPRSTSVEYEQQAQNSSHRRLAAPPRRMGGSKPVSRASARGSDVENDHSGENVPANGRGKSPFEHISDLTSRAMSQATFLMRQRSQEPEDIAPPSRHATDKTLVGGNGNSYDYADEEEMYQEMSKSAKKPASTIRGRNRISMDNKAYQPPTSDFEEESEEESGDERKGRRKKKKKEVGGPLRTLPVTNYDKRKKRKSRGGKGEAEDGSIEEVQEEEESVAEQRYRSATPSQRQGSVSRNSVPPSVRGSVPPMDASKNRSFNSMNETVDIADIDRGLLESIPEVEERDLPTDDRESYNRKRTRSRSRSRTRPARPFSVGASLGSFVNMLYHISHTFVISIIRACASVMLMFGNTIRAILNLLIFHPLTLIRRRRGSLASFGKFLGVLVGVYFVIFVIQNRKLFSRSSSRPQFVAPELPPGTIDELTTRLISLENILAGIQADTLNEKDRLDADLRRARDVASKVYQLETRVDKEAVRAQKLQEEATVMASRGIEQLAKEIRTLQSQQSSRQSDSQDEQARAKLNALEERVGSVEGGVKEALELGQQAAKAGSVAAGGAAWWNKLASGKTPSVTIKSSDGQDLTALFQSLIDQALIIYGADGIARPDYALSTAGAFVIPRLTSETYSLQKSYFFGLIGGSSHFVRSPVHALHFETHLGHCWPMKGSHGHIGVMLSAPVKITDITIDHAQSQVAYDLRQAPRDMEVWALVEGADNLAKLADHRSRLVESHEGDSEGGQPTLDDVPVPGLLRDSGAEYVQIANFTYDIRAPKNIQTFPISEDIRALDMDFGVVVLLIKSNWGHEDYTCLYRLRVHGDRLIALPEPDE